METEIITYTKSEITKELGIQSYIIALWEKQFGIIVSVTNGEPRYSSQDRALFVTIKKLLYEEKFTIEQAKKKLNAQSEDSIIAASGLFGIYTPNEKPQRSSLLDDLKVLQQQLIKLREQL